MIVNLYVDHLMKTPPASAEEFWNATREHPRVFSTAAHQIGLSDSEYAEFRKDLLDGKAVYVKLPHRLDAMSGNRRGYVYAVKNAVLPKDGALGWEVTLANGAQVYVPQICGNISLLRGAPAVALAGKPKPYAHHGGRVAPVAYVPKEVAVDVLPPTATAGTSAAPIAGAPVVAQLPFTAVAAHAALSPLYALPLIGGIILGVTHGGNGGSTTPVPACNLGSNNLGVCQGK